MTDAITFDEILGRSDGLSNLPGIDYHIGGAGDDPLTGSGTVANYLWGMAGNDTLIGGATALFDVLWGGFGSDTLTGGIGTDYFMIGSPLEGIDKITDFNASQGDKILVSRAGFGIAPGDYSSFNYDSSTGVLNFKGEQFAQLEPNIENFDVSRNIIL